MYCNYFKKKKPLVDILLSYVLKQSKHFAVEWAKREYIHTYIYIYIYTHTKAFILKQSSFKHFEKLTTGLGYCKDPIWVLSPRVNRILTQRVQYNEFVESGSEN